MRRLILAFALICGLPLLAGCLPLILDSGGDSGTPGSYKQQFIPLHPSPPGTQVRNPKDTLGGGPTT
jgi:hypothetical protein